MKTMIERLKLARFAALAIAIGLAGSTWAAAPTATAVWDTNQIKTASDGSIVAVQGDFETAASGYSITVGTGNTVDTTKGIITIGGSAGVTFDIPTDDIGASFAVVFKYSNATKLSTHSIIASSLVANGDASSYELGVLLNKTSSKICGFWNANGPRTDLTTSALPSSGYLLFTYKDDTGTRAYVGNSLATLEGATDGYLKFGSNYGKKISIGGPTGDKSVGNACSAWNGLKIEKIAFFKGQLFDKNSLKEFQFPSDEIYTATINADTDFANISWDDNKAPQDAAATDCVIALTIQNNAVVTLPTTFSASAVTANGGTLKFAASDTPYTVTTEIAGDSGIIVEAGATVTLSNAGIKNTITNNGTLNATGCTLAYVTNNSVLNFDNVVVTSVGDVTNNGTMTVATYVTDSHIKGSGSLICTGYVPATKGDFTGPITVDGGSIATPVTYGGTTLNCSSLSVSGCLVATAMTAAPTLDANTVVDSSFDGDGFRFVPKSVATVSVATESGTNYYTTLANGLAAVGDSEATITLLAETDSAISLKSGQTLVNGNLTSGGVTGPNGYEVVNNNGTYTLVDNTASTWNPTDGNAWSTAANWSTGYVPTQYTVVTFNDEANVELDGNVTIAGAKVNGSVAITATQRSLNSIGNITGNGTLTLSDVCLASAAAEGIAVGEDVDVNFTNDSELARTAEGYAGVTLNGDVTISDTFKVWNVQHNINGTLTINSGASLTLGSNLFVNGAATVKGAFTRSNNGCIKFFSQLTIEEGAVVIDGSGGNFDDEVTVVLARASASVTDSRGQPIADNKVSTTVAGSYVKKVVNGYANTFSVETYKIVTFVDEDGTTVLQTVGNLKIGDPVGYTGATPTKDATAQYTYTFTGWDDGTTQYGPTDALPAVTGDVTYTATYSSTVNNYKVTIPTVEHASTVVVTVGDDVIPLADGGYTVPYGSTVTITYTADEGYFFGTSKTKVVEIASVEGDTAVPAEQAGSTTAAVAQLMPAGYYYPSIDAAYMQLYLALMNEATAYLQVLDSEAETPNIYGAGNIGYDANARRYAKAVAKVVDTADYYPAYTTLQDAIDDYDVVNGRTISLLVSNSDSVTLANNKSVTILASDPITYNAPVAAGDYTVDAGETVEGVTTYAARDWYTWTLELGTHPNATVTDLPVAVSEGAANKTVSFTVAADATYKITAVKVDGVAQVGDNGTYTYTVSGDAIVTVETELDVATVTFYNEDGTATLQSDDVTIGQVPTAPEAPEKATTAQYTYTFAGWATEQGGAALAALPAVAAGGATYYAVYTATVNNYVVSVPAVANATIESVKVNGSAAEAVTGGYSVPYGATVIVTYAPAAGYHLASGALEVTYTNVTGAGELSGQTLPSTALTVAKIGDNCYASLEAAIAAAQAGDTVTLVANETADRVQISKALTLDLGGNTLTARVTVWTGAVTVQNGTIAGRFDAYDDSAVTLAANATVNGNVVVWGDGTYGETGCKTPTLNINGTVVATGEDAAVFTSSEDTSHPVVNINAGASITADESAVTMAAPDGVLTMNGGAVTSGIWGVFVTGGSTFTMNGGSIAFGEGGFGVGNHGNNSAADGTDTVITIAGGTISGPDTAVYHAGEGVLSITGGSITGVTGVEVRAGTLNIPSTSTAVITATGDFDESYNGSGSTVSGAAVAVSQHTTNRPINANIHGGTFSSTGTDGVAFYVTDTVNADPTEVTATVSGGTFYAPVVIDDSAADIGAVIPANSTARFSDATADGVEEGYGLVPVANSDLYEVVKFFSVTYKNGDEVLWTGYVAPGATTPAFVGEDPTKDDDVEDNGTTTKTVTSYAFVGWGEVAATVTEDVVYTATFNPTVTVTTYVATVNNERYETLAEAMAVGGTVTLLKDVVLDGPVEVGGAVVLDMAGFTVSSAQPYIFEVTSTGDLTITGNGAVTGPENGAAFDGKALITVDEGKLTIVNGTFTATGSGSDGMYGVYVLNGGTAVFGDQATGTGPTITSHFAAIGTNFTTAPADITVYGGVYTANATPTNNEWWYYFCASVYAAGSGEYTLAGGEFNGYYGVSARYADAVQTVSVGDVTINAVSGTQVFVDSKKGAGGEEARTVVATSDAVTAPAGYKWVETANGYELAARDYVAQVGTQKFESLAEAVRAAVSGETVILLTSCEGEGIFLGSSNAKTVTIDFGGFTYTVVTPVGSSGTVNQMLHFEAGNTVTLMNGRIEVTDDAEALAAFEMVMQNYCNLTIEGMTIDGTGIAVATYSDPKYQAYPGWYNTAKPQFNYNGSGTSVIRDSTITVVGDFGIDDTATLTIEDDVVINANKITTKGTDERYASANPTITVENGAAFSFDCSAILADDQNVVEEDGVYTVTGKTYVAQIGTTKYETLADAVAAANAATGAVTIELLSDLDFSEEAYAGYKWAGSTYNPLTIANDGVTIDLGGHTISNMGNCALVFGHILAKDGRIANCVIRNGTLLAGTTGDVRNSYVLGIAGVDDMTIENVTTLGGINVYTASTGVVIDGCTVQGTKYYTVCAQCGSQVTIRGTTYTKNTDSTVANKSMFWIQGAGSDSDLVTTGNTTGAFGTSIISIEGGDFTVDTANGGAFYLASGVTPTVSGGTFNIPVPANCCAVGFEPAGEEAPYTVKVKETAAVVTTEVEPGNVVTNAVLELTAEAAEAIIADSGKTLAEALVAEDANGLKKWENYVLDIDTTESEDVKAPAVQAAASDTKEEAKLNLSFTPKSTATTGIKVSYKVDTVTVDNGVATTNRADTATAAPAVKLDDLEAGKTKYVTVRAVLTSSTGTETEVEVQKVVGVMAVNSTQQNTIVAVPWESFNGTSITANELVYTGNRTAGDTLTVYVPSTGKYKTWTLDADGGSWASVTTYSLGANGDKTNQQSGNAVDQLIPRGAGVWVYRQNVDEKIYLLGQKPEAETATVTVEKGYNLVAPVVTDSSQTTIAVNEVVPVAEEKVDATANDKVLIPVAGKAPYNLYYNKTLKKWGYDLINVGDNYTVTKEFVEEVSIPTGTGFWYISGANGNKDITIGTESTTQE